MASAVAAPVLPPLPEFKGRAGWEFTDLSGVDVDAYSPVEAGEGDAGAVGRAAAIFDAPDGAVRLAQVDGRPLAEGSGGDGEALVLPLDVALERHAELVQPHLGSIVPAGDPFVARNDAGWTGGALVYVPRGKRLDAPAMLAQIQELSGRANVRRTLIVLEEDAEAEVWEQYLSAGEDVDGLFNAVVEIVVGPNARLRYVCGQGLAPSTTVFGTQRAVVDARGSLEWIALGFGSGNGQVRMETQLRGEGAEARVTGAYATGGRQHVDFDTTQEHAAPHTTSDLAFRGVLAGRSTSVWRGMIKVDPGAQQTDAFQDNRNLLLSKRAHADAIPGLEILANDVRCTHAAAVAQIDREQLFYLMSRGLPREQATRLIIDGFLQSLVERLGEGSLHDAVSGALERRLSALLD
ncbi:MAG TPA: Fe-S cluster assembly protein SufD [Thermoleophilaceae bacterium]